MISGNGPISDAFKALQINTFSEVCEWVRALPYKRNSTKHDPQIVIKEKCGTCSSKHEIIKRLAEENRIEDCKLILCMFQMSGKNTPKVKSVLEKYGLNYIPEAHTYITLEGEIIDLTFPHEQELLYLKDVLHTEEIGADQLLNYKEATHKAFLKQWRKKNRVSFTFEELWKIREECIEVMSK